MFGNQGLRLREGFSVSRIEFPGDITSELQMLLLVLANGYAVCLVEKNVSGLENGVIEDPGWNGLETL